MGPRMLSWIFLGMLLFVLDSCTTFDGVKDKLSEWFADDPQYLTKRPLSVFEFENKLRGAWAGKMIGMSYGAPYEFQFTEEIQETAIRPWQPEFINASLSQEDLYVQMTFLETLVDKGIGTTSLEAGEVFKNTLYPLSHANREARLNLQAGILPADPSRTQPLLYSIPLISNTVSTTESLPESGHPRYNPHTNDLDFQSEADLFGILCPGMPVTAVKSAERFGRIMSYGDGLYGGLFVAAMYSMAYFTEDRVKVVQAGLTSIPRESEYHQLIQDALSHYQSNPEDWRSAWQMLEQKWAQNDLCPEGWNQPANYSAKLNGGYVVIGLLYGEGDMAKTLEITTQLGQDSKSNAGLAAGVLGCMIGYDRIPQEFTLGIPLNADQNFTLTRYSFETLIPECKKMTQAIVERFGGSTSRLGDRSYLEIPVQVPETVVQVQQYTKAMQDQFQTFHAQLPEFRRKRVQDRMQSRLNSWAPDWVIQDWGFEMNPGFRDRYGDAFDVLITHPVSAERPAVLSWQGTVPSGSPVLRLRVAASNSDSDADWLLRIRINQQAVYEQIIKNQADFVTWTPVNLDLKLYAGQAVTIQLENHLGISRYPAAAWDVIEIIQSDSID